MVKFIPPEITDRIIDFLYYDHKTLGVCSLVCREWVPSARTHLFNCFFFEAPSRQVKFHLERLLEYAPHVGHYVRELYFGRMFRFDQASVDLFCSLKNLQMVQFACVLIDPDTLISVLSSLPSLKAVLLLNLYLLSNHSILLERRPALATPNGIQRLVMKGTSRFKLFQSSAGLDLFQHVKTLEYFSNVNVLSDYEEKTRDTIELCTFWKRYGSNLVNVELVNLTAALSERE
jgi:hypothetical protein